MEIPVINLVSGERVINLIIRLRAPVENIIDFQKTISEEGIHILTLNYFVRDERILATVFLKVNREDLIDELENKLSRLSYVEEFKLNVSPRMDLVFDLSEVKTIWGGRVRAAIFSLRVLKKILEEGVLRFSTAILSIWWYIGRFTGSALVEELLPLFEEREWIAVINAVFQYCKALGLGGFKLIEWDKIREEGLVKVVQPIDLEATGEIRGVSEYRVPLTRGVITGIFEKALSLEEKVLVKVIGIRMAKKPLCIFKVKLIK